METEYYQPWVADVSSILPPSPFTARHSTPHRRPTFVLVGADARNLRKHSGFWNIIGGFGFLFCGIFGIWRQTAIGDPDIYQRWGTAFSTFWGSYVPPSSPFSSNAPVS